jgi:TetR/AcrR family tetracycline transcriptional repressor
MDPAHHEHSIEHSAENVRRPAPNLERDKVVEAALELLNEGGFEGLTLRRLADKLGVKAAALYWHFKNKQDLIDQVATKILAVGNHEQMPENASWETILRLVAHHSHAAFIRYRDGALVIANADLTTAAPKQGREKVLEKLLAQGFTTEQAWQSMYVIGRYTLGCVIEEQSDPTASTRPNSPEERFEMGLDIILAGIAQKITP